VTTNPDARPGPAGAELPAELQLSAPDPQAAESLPPGYEEFAGEITVANRPMPGWFRRLPYILLIVSLAYYVYVRAFDPVNLVFAALFIIWMIYTPIAQRRGWFFIPM
jgi:hypothetical protein